MFKLIIAFLVTFNVLAFNKICLEGHSYWSSDKRLAIILSDDGKPVKCENRPPSVEDTKLISLATTQLILLDNADDATFWDQSHPIFQQAISKVEWIKKSRKVSNQVGKIVKRESVSSTVHPKSVATITFHSSFSLLPIAKEVVHFSYIDGQWKIDGVFVKPRD